MRGGRGSGMGGKVQARYILLSLMIVLSMVGLGVWYWLGQEEKDHTWA
jgi:hypothetical protein